MARLLLLIICVLIPSLALAKNRIVTARGVIDYCGTDDCSITKLNPGYGFRPYSEISNKIFSKCGLLDDCEITGIVNEHENFVFVSRVRKINTAIEPSADKIMDAAYYACSIQDKVTSGELYIDYVNAISVSPYIKNGRTVWIINFTIHCTDNYKHRIIGPSKVYLTQIDGKWHSFKTKP